MRIANNLQIITIEYNRTAETRVNSYKMVTARPFESITVKKYHFFVYDRCATR